MSNASGKIEKTGGPAVILNAAAYVGIEKLNPGNQRDAKVMIAEGSFNEVPFQSVKGFLEVYKKQNAKDVLAFRVGHYAGY